MSLSYGKLYLMKIGMMIVALVVLLWPAEVTNIEPLVLESRWDLPILVANRTYYYLGKDGEVRKEVK